MIKLETEKTVPLGKNIFYCFSWKELKSDSSSLYYFSVTTLEKKKKDVFTVKKEQTPPYASFVGLLLLA